jgi:hypothetical protein
MRFMVFMLPNMDPDATVADDTPTAEAVAEMTTFNDELVKAGVMLTGEGLHPQSEGVRVHYTPGKVDVVDGPYTEAKEAIGGFWMVETKTKDEVVEWFKRVPRVQGIDGEFTIEIRQVYEMDEFPEDVQRAAGQS